MKRNLSSAFRLLSNIMYLQSQEDITFHRWRHWPKSFWHQPPHMPPGTFPRPSPFPLAPFGLGVASNNAWKTMGGWPLAIRARLRRARCEIQCSHKISMLNKNGILAFTFEGVFLGPHCGRQELAGVWFLWRFFGKIFLARPRWPQGPKGTPTR